MQPDKKPMTRDGVLLKVGDNVFTHVQTGSGRRNAEVVLVDGDDVLVRQDGVLAVHKACLCWGRDDAMLKIWRQQTIRDIAGIKTAILDLPVYEAELAQLDADIAEMNKFE